MSKTREEAVAAGIAVSDTRHHMKRRAPWHDYRSKGTYMLTVVTEGRAALLGRLKTTIPADKSTGTAAAATAGTAAAGKEPAAVSATVELSALGRAIRDEELRKISTCYPAVEVWKVCIMPDHIHIIVRVKEDMPEGQHLGLIVRGFKGGCSRAWWRLQDEGAMPCVKTQGTEADGGAASVRADGGAASVRADGGAASMRADGGAASVRADGGAASVRADGGAAARSAGASVPAVSTAGKPEKPEKPVRPSLFESGYCDKILLREGQLDNWKRYLDDNPRRLAIKRLYPEFFHVIQQDMITGKNCQMVGNRFLLDIPDKMAVIVHGGWDDQEYAKWRKAWLACGANGGVLVSASIATREKAVMREAMDSGYRIIVLRENGFPPIYKPSGESFEACAEGRLLQISPWEYHMQRKTISREQCLKLNRMAEQIAEGDI